MTSFRTRDRWRTTVLRASMRTASSSTSTDNTATSAIAGNSTSSSRSTTSSTGRTVSHTAPGTGQFRAASPGSDRLTTVTQRACSTKSEPDPENGVRVMLERLAVLSERIPAQTESRDLLEVEPLGRPAIASARWSGQLFTAEVGVLPERSEAASIDGVARVRRGRCPEHFSCLACLVTG